MRIKAVLLFSFISSFSCASPDARQIIQTAIDAWRGENSYSEMSMRIHRSSWQRSVSLRAWTKGDKDSLVRVTAPKKDFGTASLSLEKGMWTFSPKVNRVIKVPSSMMSQSWLGSDFSHKDVSKADEIVHNYHHRILREELVKNRATWVIEAVPKEDAAVVWGKQLIWIRDDFIMMREEFYDQDGVLVKTMETLNTKVMDGRTVATRQRMSNAEEQEKWTEISVHEIEFDIALKDYIFTLSNLRNPRE